MLNEKLGIFVNTLYMYVWVRVHVCVYVCVQAIIAGIEANRTSSRILGRNFRRMEEGPRSSQLFHKSPSRYATTVWISTGFLDFR